MQEVSCRALDFLFPALKERGIDPKVLLTGVDYSLAHLQNKKARIDWAAWVRIMKNAGEVWSDTELEKVGEGVISSPYIRPFMVIVRFLFSLKDQYRWLYTTGAGNELFRCVRPTYIDRGGNRIELHLTTDGGFEPCRQFMHVSKGFLEYLPEFMGFDRAHVVLKHTENGAIFELTLPQGGIVPTWRKVVSWLFDARGAARELKEAHEDLNVRYRELEVAKEGLVNQARQLRTAHEISSAIHGDLNLDRVLSAVADALVQTAGFTRAVVEVDTQVEAQHVSRKAVAGRDSHDNIVQRTLTSRRQRLGQLTVWGFVEAAEQLIEVLLPTVSMALDNALSFTAVTNYRANLERMVRDRTAQLEAALAVVRQQQEARQRIFQNISHELRTPLALIGLATGDIEARDGENISSKTKERLTQIDDAVNRLLHLFDGMLLLAAGQEDKLRIRPKECDLAILLRSLVSAWNLTAEKHSVHLGYVGPDRLACRIDEQGIERAVTNLLSNAMKFTPAGGTVEVRLAERPNQRVEILVSDNGVGMDDEFLKRVFGRFEQGPAPVRPGERGSGIGLAIVKDICVAHGGEASVKSSRGQGSTFTLSIPREPDDAKLAAQGEGAFIPSLQAPPPDATPSAEQRTEVQKVIGGKDYTVLVAEDDPQLRAFLVELLSREYNVIAAPDGLAALALAEQHQPHLLLSDVGMPGLTGIELTRRFREASGFRLAPVILVTAYALTESRLDGLEAGAVDYITKPFHPGELLARVRGQLELRQMALRLHETQKLAGLGVLAAGLAHELRNPATGVVSAIEPLKKMLPPEAKSQAVSQLLEAITQGSKQLEVLTRQLIGFNRQGPLEVRAEPLGSIFDTAESLSRPALESRVIRRELEYTGNVRCSRGLIIQVLVNLFENAAHASAPESEITLRTRELDGFVLIDVQDQGPGVKTSHKERLFDPFFTTKDPGKGTGLGLTVSRLIAERHGGTLQCLDTERGATFRLELPLTEVDLPTDSPRLMSMAGAPV